jgi:parallel beta-helix repeat protein
MFKKIYITALFFIIAMGLSAQQVWAAEYFVSPTGTSGNQGSQQSPWSLGHAATQAQPGDIITVRAGTYQAGQDGVGLRPGRSGINGQPITFRAYAGERPIIQGGSTNLDLTDRDFIVIDGFTFRDPQGRWATLANADRNEVRNSLFTFTTTSAGLANGWTGFEIGQDNTGANPSSYNRVTGNTFEKWGIWHPYENGGPALAIYSNGSSFNVIENNQFYDASHSDVRVTTRRNVVRSNRFSNSQQKNLELGGNTGEFGVSGSTLVEGNDFGAAEFNREEHGGMHIHIYSEDNIIRRNTFHDAAAYSIDIFVEPGTGESARNNAQHGATENRIFNNTFANNSVKHFNQNNQAYQVHCPPVICIIRFSDQN